jgi:CrcB protein
MLNYLWVMLGGALGTGARFWASGFVAQRAGEFFPLGTLAVNIVGSFFIGFIATATDPLGRMAAPPLFRQFFMIGVIGGFTTFSSFSWQTLELAQEGDWLRAGLNVVLSVFCCLVAVWAGRTLALILIPR